MSLNNSYRGVIGAGRRGSFCAKSSQLPTRARCCDDAISWADIWRDLAFTMIPGSHYSVILLVLPGLHAWASTEPASQAVFYKLSILDRQLPSRSAEGMMQFLAKPHRPRASPSPSWHRSSRLSTEWSRRTATLNHFVFRRQNSCGTFLSMIIHSNQPEK